jgi:hypothetical protein
MSCALNDSSYFFIMSNQRIKSDCIQRTYEDYRRLYPIGYALLEKQNVRKLAAEARVQEMDAAAALWRVYTQIYMPTVSGTVWSDKSAYSPAQWQLSLYASALAYLQRRADENERLRRVYARVQTKPVLEARQINAREIFRSRETPGIAATVYTLPWGDLQP